MPICDNCSNPAEYKVYLNGIRNNNGSAPVEIPLYVISCIDCLDGYQAPGTQTVQCFTISKPKVKVIKKSKYL